MDRGIEIIQVHCRSGRPWAIPVARRRVQPAELAQVSFSPSTASATRPTTSTTTRPHRYRFDGRLTDIVEFPFAWVLDDAPFFQYSITLPGRTMQAPSAVFEAWRREFDVLYREDR